MKDSHSFRTAQKKNRLVIVGPTAVGKTSVSEIIAEKMETDIILADSRQIYQGMEIGTNKPTLASRKKIHRHLIDLIPPDHFFSAGAYKKKADRVIKTMEAAGKTILIEGGTGLYIKALLYGIWDGPPADWDLRKKLLNKEALEGAGTLHKYLLEIDPISGARIHMKDIPRIIRAIEVYVLVNRPLSEIHAEDRLSQKKDRSFEIIGLRRTRKDLYERIEARIDNQIALGLLDETENLLAAGMALTLPAMCGLGYRQIISYLQGKKSLDEAVAIFKRDTRRYAKRQMTWFRADRNIAWIDLDVGEPPEETAERVMRLKKCSSVL
ncbi:MAG: tRNA (adenosine(37)-N6)-dimethylallyltransferase MiaA [Nitrospiria bacterium]